MELLNDIRFAIPIYISFLIFSIYKPIVCLIIFGLVLTIIGLRYWRFITEIHKSGIKSIGKIIFYESDKDGYKTPTIEFETRNGIRINKKPYYYSSTDLSKIKSYRNKINQPISILYDKKNPERFVLEPERTFSYFTLTIVILAGFVFMTFGILSIFNIIQIDL